MYCALSQPSERSERGREFTASAWSRGVYIHHSADQLGESYGAAVLGSSPCIVARGAGLVVSTTRDGLIRAWSEERAAARASKSAGDVPGEWAHLERAHILSQPIARAHVRTHVAMLRVAARRRDWREIRGQLLRVVVAGPGSLTGRYPVGNTGGANVSATLVMPIPDDLRQILDASSSNQ